MTGLYIHIPYCRAKCAYCDFASVPSTDGVPQAYVDALAADMQTRRGARVETVYIGGGTPSLLSPVQIRQVGALIADHADTGALTEMTCEVNPESVTLEKLEALRAIGVNRISMGLQSTRETDLRALGRIHSFSDFTKAWRAVRDTGFSNCGADLIFGLPGQTVAAWQSVLAEAASCNPEHLSLYALTIEPGTPLAERGAPVDADVQADMYEWAVSFLSSRGYEHYEISNWAKPGFRSRHNLMYWRGGRYVGVGAAAASYDGARRFVNERSPDVYCARLSAGVSPIVDDEIIDEECHRRERVMLGLRLSDGIPRSAIADSHAASLDTFIGQGLMEHHADSVRLTDRGMLLSNVVLREFV